MANATHVKKKELANGKTKFQAQVYYQGVYYCAKTFDTEKLAKEYKEASLKAIIQGELKSAADRSAQRQVDDALDQPMTHWATHFLENEGRELSKSRRAEYELVGRLVADKTLRDFDGADGARLIKQLLDKWRTGRISKRAATSPGEQAPALKPLSDQTRRLRFYALMGIIGSAHDALPPGTRFEMPDMGTLKKFKMPAPYSAPRSRQPSDEEIAALLMHLGADSELGQFLRAIEETGCRLSEVRNATGEDTHLYLVGGEVVGGHLHLEVHKTSKKTGPRDVPLSAFAAQLLHQRKLQHGDGRLFPDLGDTDWVCKKFDDACEAVGIRDLLIKDIRRAFINRNKYHAAHVDLAKTMGASSLLVNEDVSSPERALLTAVGHTTVRTMSGYSHPELVHLSQVFSSTSRWPQVARLIATRPSTKAEAERPADVDVSALQNLLAETLAKLRSAGIMSSPLSRVSGADAASTGPRAPAPRHATVAATASSGAVSTCPSETAVSLLWRPSERSDIAVGVQIPRSLPTTVRDE